MIKQRIIFGASRDSWEFITRARGYYEDVIATLIKRSELKPPPLDSSQRSMTGEIALGLKSRLASLAEVVSASACAMRSFVSRAVR